MAAVQTQNPVSLTFEAAEKKVEQWAEEPPTEEEQLEFLRKAIKDLGEPGNEEVFKAAMKELGVRAVNTDNAFARVKNTLDAFVTNHGDRFPGLKAFQTEWNGYRSVR